MGESSESKDDWKGRETVKGMFVLPTLLVKSRYAYFYKHTVDICWRDRAHNSKEAYFELTSSIFSLYSSVYSSGLP